LLLLLLPVVLLVVVAMVVVTAAAAAVRDAHECTPRECHALNNNNIIIINNSSSSNNNNANTSTVSQPTLEKQKNTNKKNRKTKNCRQYLQSKFAERGSPNAMSIDIKQVSNWWYVRLVLFPFMATMTQCSTGRSEGNRANRKCVVLVCGRYTDPRGAIFQRLGDAITDVWGE
jgi:hypothetical protein